MYFIWPYTIVSRIWHTSELSPSHLSRATAIFVVDCCQFGPSWIFGLKTELMVCAGLVGGTTEQICLFLILYDIINDMKYLRNCLHYTSAVPQQRLLLIAANLALTGFLGWKWSLWYVPPWLAVQRSKAIFFLVLYDGINDMKYFQNCLPHTSAVPQPSLLLMAANLALTGYVGWKWSLWSVPDWLTL